jgi:probable rRNA maturation factor
LIVFRKNIAGISKRGLTQFITSAQRAVKLRGVITILITHDEEMKSLNLRFRNKDKATDVLSFPSSLNLRPKIAGDVAISAKIAGENAANLGHSVFQELKILILHGILHLAGHDHETDSGEMAKEEQRLRKKLHLPVSLIERTEGHNADTRSAPTMKKVSTASSNKPTQRRGKRLSK